MTKRRLTPEKEAAFFEQYAGIVYGAMKRLGILCTHPDYEDYAQHGLMKLVEAYETYPETVDHTNSRNPFAGYAYQRVRWHLLDLLRKAQKKTEHETGLPETFDTLYPDDQSPVEESQVERELVRSMLSLLTETEQRYLVDLVLHQLTPTEMAEKYGVSRKTVYTRRKKIGHKLRHFLPVLKNETGQAQQGGEQR